MDSFQITSSPTDFLTLAEAKAHLVVDYSDDDDLITRMISAACRWCESYTGRFYTPTTVVLSRNGFAENMRLRFKPVQEIVSVEYDDGDTEGSVLSADRYQLDAHNNCLVRAYGAVWPSTRYHWNSVRITYRVGYFSSGSPESVSVPEDIKNAALLVLGDLYANRERQQDMALYHNTASEMLANQYRVCE